MFLIIAETYFMSLECYIWTMINNTLGIMDIAIPTKTRNKGRIERITGIKYMQSTLIIKEKWRLSDISLKNKYIYMLII